MKGGREGEERRTRGRKEAIYIPWETGESLPQGLADAGSGQSGHELDSDLLCGEANTSSSAGEKELCKGNPVGVADCVPRTKVSFAEVSPMAGSALLLALAFVLTVPLLYNKA